MYTKTLQKKTLKRKDGSRDRRGANTAQQHVDKWAKGALAAEACTGVQCQEGRGGEEKTEGILGGEKKVYTVCTQRAPWVDPGGDCTKHTALTYLSQCNGARREREEWGRRGRGGKTFFKGDRNTLQKVGVGTGNQPNRQSEEGRRQRRWRHIKPPF